jgi:signal transduction histidine kinase
MILLIASYLLKMKTVKLNTLQSDYNELRDKSSSYSQLMEEKNRSILKNQDYEINLATLNERNRISRELHDNIGHMLSRSLLQVGALLTISKDETVKEGLTSLKSSLSTGMDDIRSSIHQMYDDSVDLYTQVEQLVKNFTFCGISFEYNIKNPPPLVVKHSLIAIVKEALANIMKHSNAKSVIIRLWEHPAMYQLIVQDDGMMEEYKKKEILKELERQDYGEGMGLRNIYDRVKSFDGNINITLDNGFKIFITVPKKKDDTNF